jgi:hypothetical protein
MRPLWRKRCREGQQGEDFGRCDAAALGQAEGRWWPDDPEANKALEAHAEYWSNS